VEKRAPFSDHQLGRSDMEFFDEQVLDELGNIFLTEASERLRK